MKAVAVLGSPRKNGNSTLIAEKILDLLNSNGSDVSAYHLNELNFKGCQGCAGCKSNAEHCVVDDDLTEVLQEIEQAELVVIASPVYFSEISGQTKSFIDRTFSYLNPNFINSETPSRLLPGKSLIFILTQGMPDENTYKEIFPKYESFFKFFGFAHTDLIRGIGLGEPGEALQKKEIMDQVKELAAAVVERYQIV